MKMDEKCERPWKLSCPEAILLVGSPATGKSSFVERLLHDRTLWPSKPYSKIVYAYGIYSDTVARIEKTLENVELHHGVPEHIFEDPQKYFDPSECGLLILDDIGVETQQSKSFTKFLMRGLFVLKTFFTSFEDISSFRCNTQFNYTYIHRALSVWW